MTTAVRRQLFCTRHLIDVGARPNPVLGLTLVVPDVTSPDGYRDAVPADYAPDGEKMWEWDPAKVILYPLENLPSGKLATAYDLDREAASKALGPNVGEFLYENQQEISRIPGIDRVGGILFMGQVFRGDGGNLCVRYLYWDGEHWARCSFWLDSRIPVTSPAALLHE